MATNDSENIVIEILLDDGQIAKGFVKATKTAKTSGEKAGKDFSKGVYDNTDNLDGLTDKLKGVGLALIASLGTKEVISASIEQDKAVKKMESSLRALGEYTPELSLELQDYASELQKTSRFGDEATLGQIAFAQAMGANVEQSKEIVKTAQNLAVAIDIDFNSAVRNVTKTLGGFSGELGEVIPELKNLTTAQLQNGEGVALLSEKYKNFALRDLESFDGKMKQTVNTIGDFAEVLGDLITKSDVSTGVMSDLSFMLNDVAIGLVNLRKAAQGDEQKELNEDLDNQNKELERLLQLQQNIKDGKNDGDFLDFIFGSTTVEDVQVSVDRVSGKIKELKAEIGKLSTNEGNNKKPILEVKDEDLEALRLAQSEYEVLSEKYKQMGYDAETASLAMSNPEFATEIEQSNQRISLSFERVSNALGTEARKIKVTNAQIASSMINGIGGATTKAFSEFGRALAEGDNALEAMLNSFLSGMGSMAVQLGSMYMLEGAAMLFSPNPTDKANAPGLISAGAALAAFGGVMGAIGGGGASSSSSDSSSSSSNELYTQNQYDSLDYSEKETEERSPTEEYHFHGDVLGDDNSANRIVELLKIAKGNGAYA